MNSSAGSKRYEVLDSLGEGGMAVVQKVRDIETGATLAIKRLHPPKDEGRGSRARALLQREYHTLSQLAHPRVIEVYDYGIDEQGPYYTMEPLDGGDLQQLAPVPWKEACALMRDVCSVLSLLHSRRLVHRDISPRNIRCTANGMAKLLDFGAMAPMGIAREVVGTPAICAPEVVNRERLDSRADLYSLGCTLYYALVGAHAFPARDFGQLPLLWGQPPSRPSQQVEGLPKQLDSLVMRLISLDPAARPSSAAEVIDRLSAIAGLAADEQLPVSHAYLTTPVLVGREGSLQRVRRKIERAALQRGGAVLVLGKPGVGCSRFLDAVLLEGKFSGLAILRGDAVDAQHGEGGVVLALARQLLRVEPELSRAAAAPYLGVLGHFLPELVEGAPEGTLVCFDDPQQRRPRLQHALRNWVEAVSAQRPLALGVDDLDQADDFSAAFIALLAHNAPSHRVLIVATADAASTEQGDGPLTLLAEASSRVVLSHLRARDTEALLRSVFGDTHHIQHLAYKLHQITDGNPRDVMDLARHLVEREVIRYADGAWSVPADIDDADLPASIAEALAQTVAQLDEDSLQLARGMALAPELHLDAGQMLLMTEHRDQGRLMKGLDRLLASGVLRGSGNLFELSQSGWVAPLFVGVDDAARRSLYLRLADVFMHLDEPLRAADCQIRAGEVDQGLDTMVEYARSSVEVTSADPEAYARMLRTLPGDWSAILHRSFDLCEQQGRPARDLFALHVRGAGIATAIAGDPRSVKGLFAQLTVAVGLDLYESLHDVADPRERLRRALLLAEERYASLSEAERVLPLKEALPALGYAYLEAIGCVVNRLDLSLWESMPSIRPLAALSPVLAIVDMLGRGVACRLTARSYRTRDIYAKLLARAEQPDRAGLDKTHHETMVNMVKVGLAFVEANAGSKRALDILAELPDSPLYEVNRFVIEMLYHLEQGDSDKAEACRQRSELSRIQNGARQLFARPNLTGELIAYAAMDDLLQIKQALPTVVRMAEKVGTWVPVMHYARGEYHRIRGSHSAALEELQLASGLVVAGNHPLYCEIQGAYMRALMTAGRYGDARDHGLTCLKRAEEADLDYTIEAIRLPLALAYAHTDLFGLAQQLADVAADALDEIGAGKLLRGVAEETCARVAILAGDQVGVDEHVEECGRLYKAHGNRALIAKYERLVEDALQAGLEVEGRRRAHDAASESAIVNLSTVLSAYGKADERAKHALELMRKEAAADGAVLYAVEQDGPVHVATTGTPPEGADLNRLVRVTLSQQAAVEDEMTRTGTCDGALASERRASTIHTPQGEVALHTLLVAHAEEGELHITGLVVFTLPCDRSFTPPAELASQLSRYWLSAGDATALTDSSHWGPVND